MADRPISALTEATIINDGDYFLLQQDDEAKKLMGDNLKQYLNRATGVTGVQKIGTSHLVDTYRMYYNNTSTTFDVANGKSIVSIDKTSSAVTYDTYTITYNDGAPTTFSVPYGKDCTVSGIEAKYAGSTSPSSIPASSYWKDSAQEAITYFQNATGESIKGNYVWTRNTLTFSTGGSNTTYLIAYQGLDGHGSVDSVNGESGDVFLYGSNLSVSPTDTMTLDKASKVLQIQDTISSLPKTVTNAEITSDMVLVYSYLSNQSVQGNDWQISTSDGSLTISGNFQGSDSTNITLYLARSRS